MTDARPRNVRLLFAQRLKETRIARGYRTARSLAQALAIDENRYTRYERAEVEPDLSLLMRICETVGATPNDLLGDWPVSRPHRLSTGFAEKAEPVDPRVNTPPLPSSGTAPRAEPAQASRETARARQRALAWQLAGELAKLEPKLDTAVRLPFADLQTKSRFFAAIERDPFAFISRLAEDTALAGLNFNQQARIAALMDELIEAVSSGHLP